MGSTQRLPTAVAATLLALALAACAPPGCAPPACAQTAFAPPACAPGLAPMQSVKLYFGGSLPEPAWQNFAKTTLTPTFPDGFTTTLAKGQWRNPQTGEITVEITRIVEIDAPDLLPKLPQIIQPYQQQFHQISVGITTTPTCAAF